MNSTSTFVHRRSAASNLAWAKIWAYRPAIPSTHLTLLLAVVLATLYNVSLWSSVVRIRPVHELKDLGFLLSFLVLMTVTILPLMIVIGFRFVQKPALVLILLVSSVAGYFMVTYGVLIDKTMIRNVFETDPGEVQELLSVGLFFHVLFLGVVPAVLVCRARITHRPFRQGVAIAIGTVALCASSVAGVAAVYYPDDASLFRNNPQLRLMAVPLNYTYSVATYLGSRSREQSGPLRALGEDAVQAYLPRNSHRRRLLILVVGETARAGSFSLNGYDRPTNPRLQARSVINFDNVSSCGTSTAISLPCMFSVATRATFDPADERSTENLLDVLNHAGASVLWRDNNSGCKGVCERAQTQAREAYSSGEHCTSAGCFDEVLLDNLEAYVEDATADVVVVLHENGSHGPTYYQRYPEAFARFTPECTTNRLHDCDLAQLANTYDNTILYTDHVLDRVIQFLEDRSERFETAMIYVSDRGESLGENQIYLHGLPYFLAPDEQTWVPLIVWLSDSLVRSAGIDRACLRKRHAHSLSHDNLFHSVLGLMDVQTRIYDPQLDLFAGCRTTRPESR